MDVNEILRIAWPVIVIQLGLQVYALLDLYKIRRTRNLNAAIWAAICVFGGLIGPILYLLLGRSEEYA